MDWNRLPGSREGYYFCSAKGKMLARVVCHSKDDWQASYLEWDEKKWPEGAWLSKAELEGMCEGDFLKGGDAWEIELGSFKSDYQAKDVVEKYVKVKIR
jgi:hypothetical protein